MKQTAKLKAEQLIDKFRNEITSFLGDRMKKLNAIRCALIAIDEIIQIDVLINEDIYVEKPSYLQYWLDVKEELEKLKNETK